MSLTRLSLRRRCSFVCAITIGFVALADWLFYGHALGANASVFAGALLLAVLMRGGLAMRRRAGRILALACSGLVVALLIEPTAVGIGMGILGLVALAIVDRGGWTAGASIWLAGVAAFLGRSTYQSFRDMLIGERWSRSRGHMSPALRTMLMWLAPVVLGGAFIALFTAANPVVSMWVRELPAYPSVGRLVFWGVAGLLVWGFLRTRLPRRERYRVPPDHARWHAFEHVTGSDWVLRSLIVFNIIFGVQTLLDLMYLYGGAALPDGMTYAEYARRGAYPLLAAALLAGVFVLLVFRPGGIAERNALARRLVYLWLGQMVVLVVSSMWRLGLYVEVYSLTRLRVAAGIWMLLVAMALVLIVVRIAKGYDSRWLVQANTLAAGLVLYACSYIGFDRLIAEFNVSRCREVVAARPADAAEHVLLDIEYIERLGPGALPSLHRYIATVDRAAHPERVRRAETLVERFATDLEMDLRDWRSWSIRRAMLAQASGTP